MTKGQTFSSKQQAVLLLGVAVIALGLLMLFILFNGGDQVGEITPEEVLENRSGVAGTPGAPEARLPGGEINVSAVELEPATITPGQIAAVNILGFDSAFNLYQQGIMSAQGIRDAYYDPAVMTEEVTIQLNAPRRFEWTALASLLFDQNGL